MKFSTLIAFATLGATAVLAAPVEQRGAHPVRRTEVPSATETASLTASVTEAPAETPTATEAPNVTGSDASVPDNTDTYLYSTITDTGSLSYTQSESTQTLPPSTGEPSATTETQYPQSTSPSGEVQQNVNIDISQTVVIRIKEVVQVTQVLVVERPVFIAVEVNVLVRKTIIVNQIQNVFINRFSQWDISIVEQFAFVISQQYENFLRLSGNAFQAQDQVVFNRFVTKFIGQFEVFQSFNLVDIQQMVIVLQGFNYNQLSTFFGRSDVLFSQSNFQQFGVSSFTVFVQQLSNMVTVIQSSPFNSDGLFNLNAGGSFNAGLSLGGQASLNGGINGGINGSVGVNGGLSVGLGASGNVGLGVGVVGVGSVASSS